MVGTLYMNTEQQIPLNLPSASTSTAKSIEPITITLTTTHTLYMIIRKFLRNGWRKRYNLSLNKHLNKPLLSIASKDVYYNEVIALLDMLKVNGAKYIASLRNGSDSMFESHYLKPFIVSLGLRRYSSLGWGFPCEAWRALGLPMMRLKLALICLDDGGK